MRKRWLAGVAALFLACILNGCRTQAHTALFSWDPQQVGQTDQKEMDEILSLYGIDALYQLVDRKNTAGLEQFMTHLAKQGVAVYALAGETEWALPSGADAMEGELEGLFSLSGSLKNGFSGIVLDVEPYRNECWEKDPGQGMKEYVANMKRAYESCRQAGLPLLLCIPYYLDEIADLSLLEELFRDACDGVIVMNYDRQDEQGQIGTEARLARQYGRQLINAYEFLPAGTHGLAERNTYANTDWEHVESSKRRLQESYPDIRFAYHSLEALKKRERSIQ